MKFDIGVIVGVLGIMLGFGGSYFFTGKGRKLRNLFIEQKQQC